MPDRRLRATTWGLYENVCVCMIMCDSVKTQNLMRAGAQNGVVFKGKGTMFARFGQIAGERERDSGGWRCPEGGGLLVHRTKKVDEKD